MKDSSIENAAAGLGCGMLIIFVAYHFIAKVVVIAMKVWLTEHYWRIRCSRWRGDSWLFICQQIIQRARSARSLRKRGLIT